MLFSCRCTMQKKNVHWSDAFVQAFPKPMPVVGKKNGLSPVLEKEFIFSTAISFRPLLDLTSWLLKRPVSAGPNETGGQNKSSYIRMESIHREGHGAGMIVQTTVWLCTFHTLIEWVGCTAADETRKRTWGGKINSWLYVFVRNWTLIEPSTQRDSKTRHWDQGVLL